MPKVTLRHLEALADRFLDHVDLTPEGRALYARAVADFLDFLEAYPDALEDPDVLLRFRGDLRERGLRPGTVGVKMAAARRFVALALLEGAAPPAWTRALERERLLRGRARETTAGPRPAPPPELLPAILGFLEARVARARRPIDRARALRDLALARLLADTGLRISEALSLEAADVFEPDGHVREEAVIRGKGRREERIYLPAATRRALEAWWTALHELRPRQAQRARAVFVSLGRGRLGRLSRQHAWRVLCRTGKALGISLFPHAFRSMLARELLRRRRDLALVQRVLRHRSPATTLRYAAASLEEVRQALEER